LAIGGLATQQLGVIGHDDVDRARETILASSNGPGGAVIRIPALSQISDTGGRHGGRIWELADARPTGLSGKCSLATSKLSVVEGGGVDWVRSLTLAAGIGPRRAVIGVPYGSASARDASEDGGAFSARLTIIVLSAALGERAAPQLIAIGLVNTARHAPISRVIRMPHGGGIFRTPWREQLAHDLVGLVVDDDDGIVLDYVGVIVAIDVRERSFFGFILVIVGRRRLLVADESAPYQ
jgi:hypothetical protein